MKRHLSMIGLVLPLVVLVGCVSREELLMEAEKRALDRLRYEQEFMATPVMCYRVTRSINDRRMMEDHEDIPCPESTVAPPANDQGMIPSQSER